MEIAFAFPLVLLAAHGVRDGCKKGGKEVAQGVGTAILKRIHQFLYPSAHIRILCFQIIGRYHRNKSILHFIIREIKKKRTSPKIKVFDSKVSALINHGERLLHISLIVNEFFGTVIASCQFIQILLRMVEQTNQISGSSAGKPEIAESLLRKSVQQTERIVHVRKVLAEMIAVILTLQHLHHPCLVRSVFLRQPADGFSEITLQFLLRNAAKSLVTPVHADVCRLVEAAEHAHLRELGDPRKQNELQVVISSLEHGIEAFEDFPVTVLKQTVFFGRVHPCARIKYIENRLVVFVYEHHAPASVPLMRPMKHIGKASTYVMKIGCTPIFLLPTADNTFQNVIQFPRLQKVRSVEVNVKHRIFRPFRLKRINGKPSEKLFPPTEITLQRRQKQTFSEASRTAEEISLSFRHQPINQLRLVHVNIVVFPEMFKALYSDRVLHNIPFLRYTQRNGFISRQTNAAVKKIFRQHCRIGNYS